MPTGLDRTQVFRVPGRLCHTPTTDPPIDAFPHGGTAFGVTSRVSLIFDQHYETVTAEEYGQAIDVLEGFSTLRMVCVLREWNDAVVAKVFGGRASAGGVSGDQGVTWSTSYRGGNALADTGIKLLWTPNNATSHPGILLYKAIPLRADSLSIPMGTFREMSFRMEFLAILDSSGRRGMQRLVSDMAL